MKIDIDKVAQFIYNNISEIRSRFFPIEMTEEYTYGKYIKSKDGRNLDEIESWYVGIEIPFNLSGNEMIELIQKELIKFESSKALVNSRTLIIEPDNQICCQLCDWIILENEKSYAQTSNRYFKNIDFQNKSFTITFVKYAKILFRKDLERKIDLARIETYNNLQNIIQIIEADRARMEDYGAQNIVNRLKKLIKDLREYSEEFYHS